MKTNPLSTRLPARLGSSPAALIVAAAVVAWQVPSSGARFAPAEGIGVFAGFYLIAQAIERLLELAPGGTKTPQARADRAAVFAGVAVLAAAVACKALGLGLLRASGGEGIPPELDVFVTALAIGGGTKPLHDLISRIKK